MKNFKFDTKNYEFNKGSKNSVYILHGFSSTTYEVKALAEFLGQNGYHTIAKNLPGHGTTVDECNRIKFKHWLDFVKEDIANLSSISDKTYVVGNSMGGVLSLFLASEFPLNGFIAGGTVLKFKRYFTTNFIVPLVCKIMKISKKKSPEAYKHIQFYGYPEYPLVALNEYRKMINMVLPKIKNIKIPGLLIHSYADRMSVMDNINMIKQRLTIKKIDTVFVKKAHHNMFDNNPDQNLIVNRILKFLKEK